MWDRRICQLEGNFIWLPVDFMFHFSSLQAPVCTVLIQITATFDEPNEEKRLTDVSCKCPLLEPSVTTHLSITFTSVLCYRAFAM